MDLKFKQKPTYKVEKETKKEDTQESLCMEVAECVTELLNAAVSFHKLHLKVTGLGSYASHKALNSLYDSLPELGDQLAEQFQGAKEELLKYTVKAPRELNTKEEGIKYIREIKEMASNLQSKLPYSEIINDLDALKSTLNSIKYKLIYLS